MVDMTWIYVLNLNSLFINFIDHVPLNYFLSYISLLRDTVPRSHRLLYFTV